MLADAFGDPSGLNKLILLLFGDLSAITFFDFTVVETGESSVKSK